MNELRFRYDIDADTQRIVTIIDGEYRFHDALVIADTLTADPRFDRRFSILIDARHGVLQSSVGELQELANELGRRSPSLDSRLAIVIADPYPRAMATYAETLIQATGITLRVLDDIESAHRFLDPTWEPGAMQATESSCAH